VVVVVVVRVAGVASGRGVGRHGARGNVSYAMHRRGPVEKGRRGQRVFRVVRAFWRCLGAEHSCLLRSGSGRLATPARDADVLWPSHCWRGGRVL
jgi:hypothetical protein